MATHLHYRKADARYYVSIDDVKVGWVLNLANDDGWQFYATVDDAIKGRRLAFGYKTRREAVREGLANLRIRHGGKVTILNMDTIKDEVVFLDEAVLQQIDDELLDEMYPVP